MTKKLFGEYLIEHGLIAAEELLAALIEQQSHLPSISEVAYRRKLFPTDGFLGIIKHQILNKSEFKVACKELKLWTSEIEKTIETEMMQNQVPIGQILVKRGNIQLDDLLKAIDEFLTESVKTSPPETEDLPQKNVPPAFSGEPSEILTESKTRDGLSKNKLVHDLNPYFRLLNQNFYKDLQLIFSLLQDEISRSGDRDLDQIQSYIKNLIHEIQSIQGACRFAEVQKSLDLAAQGEKVLKKLSLNIVKQSKQDLQRCLSSLQTMVDVLWNLRQSLESSGDELHFFNQEQKSQTYSQSLQELNQYLNEMRV